MSLCIKKKRLRTELARMIQSEVRLPSRCRPLKQEHQFDSRLDIKVAPRLTYLVLKDIMERFKLVEIFDQMK